MLMTLIFMGIAYAVGSVNSAIIVSQAMKLPDPRTDGSKNPGATNVLRLSGKQPALIVLAADIAKGLLVVWLARLLGVEGFGAGLVGLAAVAGHIFPVFYEFAGGKGVATAIGVFFGLHWFIGLVAALVWIGVAKFYNYSSLAGLSAVASAPVIALLTGNFGLILPLLLLAGLVAYQHMENIQRLQAGTETKINWNMADAAAEVKEIPKNSPKNKTKE